MKTDESHLLRIAAAVRGLLLERLWLVPALIFVLLAAGTLGPSAYFLHFDTATQDVIAADLLKGCLSAAGAKPGASLILWLAFAPGGVSPYWETAILTVLGGLCVAAVFRMAARVTGSGRWAMLGALWFASLPTVLYYTRMHIGYPLAFFALGLMLHSERRYGWAGLLFGMTVISHPSFMPPVAAWLGWAFVLDETPLRRRIGAYARIAACAVIPILVVEGLYFAFLGEVFGWTHDVVTDSLRLSALSARGPAWPVTQLIEIMAFSNGWINAALLLLGLAYPTVRKPRVPLMDALFAAGWSVVAAYSLRVATGNTFLTPRMFAGAYPPLAVTTVFTLWRLARRLNASRPAQVALRVAGAATVAVALPVGILWHALDAASGSRTAYDVVDETMAQAAEAGLPVRYFGVVHVAEFFALAHDVEMNANEPSPDIVSGDSGAVLIFENGPGTLNSGPADVRLSGRLDRSLYEVVSYPHLTLYRPACVESYGVGPETLGQWRSLAYARQPGAVRSEVEVWWPRQPSGTFVARELYEGETGTLIVHYEGGCLTPKVFDDGEKNYYDVLADRGREVWRAVARGDVREAWAIIESALGDGRIGSLNIGPGAEE